MLKLKGLTWNLDLDINLQKIIEMHPNWMPQEIALTFIHIVFKYKYHTGTN